MHRRARVAEPARGRELRGERLGAAARAAAADVVGRLRGRVLLGERGDDLARVVELVEVELGRAARAGARKGGEVL